MTRICTIAMVLTGAALQTPAALDAVERCDPAAFAALNSSSVTIRSAERAGDARPERPGLQAGGHCRVQASVSAAPGSLINFEVWIPEPWNGKLVVTGNGGYGNTPSTRDMTQALAAGKVAAAVGPPAPGLAVGG